MQARGSSAIYLRFWLVMSRNIIEAIITHDVIILITRGIAMPSRPAAIRAALWHLAAAKLKLNDTANVL